MIYEKSCGAVVYKLENGRRLYLVERTPSGKTVLPKGHVEAGETEAGHLLPGNRKIFSKARK